LETRRDKENQDKRVCENTARNSIGDGKEKKPVKTNSELMAEFFAIASDEIKK